MKTLILLLTLTAILATAGTAQAGLDTHLKLGVAGNEHDIQVINHGDASVSLYVDGELVRAPQVLP